jgi:hypothetical protein
VIFPLFEFVPQDRVKFHNQKFLSSLNPDIAAKALLDSPPSSPPTQSGNRIAASEVDSAQLICDPMVL